MISQICACCPTPCPARRRASRRLTAPRSAPPAPPPRALSMRCAAVSASHAEKAASSGDAGNNS
eukprot:6190520-Pleurochrysis_carterae.AAC.2